MNKKLKGNNDNDNIIIILVALFIVLIIISVLVYIFIIRDSDSSFGSSLGFGFGSGTGTGTGSGSGTVETGSHQQAIDTQQGNILTTAAATAEEIGLGDALDFGNSELGIQNDPVCHIFSTTCNVGIRNLEGEVEIVKMCNNKIYIIWKCHWLDCFESSRFSESY